MGKHYVPQEYLRGFSSSPDGALIWMFDKQTGRWTQPAIRHAAQQRDYYTPEVESRLEREVEGPSHIALKALRSGGVLSDDQRDALAVYFAVMMMRIPRKRRRGRELVPEVLESTMSEFRSELEHHRTADNAGRIDELLKQVDDLEERYAVEPPVDVIDQINSPWPSVRVMQAIRTMTWRIVQVPSPRYLITSDNPAFFFASLGVGTAESEVTVPVTPHLAIVASYQGAPGSSQVVVAKLLCRRRSTGA